MIFSAVVGKIGPFVGMTYNFRPSCGNRLSCGNRPICGNWPSFESFTYIICILDLSVCSTKRSIAESRKLANVKACKKDHYAN